MDRRDRYRGALLGLATGDALGTTLEFRAPGSFRKIDDMVGGDSPQAAIERPGASSRTTHGAPAAIDACRYMSALMIGALNGAAKQELLSGDFSPIPGYWDENPLVAQIGEIASGSFKRREPPVIAGSGYVAKSLEAALWAFHRSSDFREGCLLAVNLGDDADTTGAIYGQLA